MPAKPLNEQQKAEAAALKELYLVWKAARAAEGKPVTQEQAAEQFDFGQSAFNQYINGRIPLNPPAASKFARFLGVAVADFSPSVAAEIATLANGAGSAVQDVTENGAGRKGSSVAGQADSAPPETFRLPPSMSYSDENLHDCVILLGNLLSRLDDTSRQLIGTLLRKVARHALDADRVADLALRIRKNAQEQGRISRDETVNNLLTKPGAVEPNH